MKLSYRFKNWAGGLAVALSVPTVQALPLMSETAGNIKVGIVTLYKDHQDSKKVYFFPNSTRFSQDNKKVPLFNFVYWGLSNGGPLTEAGGYLSMTTRLDMDPLQKDALEKYMKENPQMEVAVLPVKSSSVGLTTTKAGAPPLGRLFEEFNFAKVGGRAEDEIGINATMTGVGAKAFRALFVKTTGGSPIKFDYCYVVQGLGPNMDATVSVDMKRVYELFSGGHSGGWGWFSWSISATVEKLHKDGVIKIEMNGGDAKVWEYLRTVSETITQRLFESELPAGATIGEASSNRPFRFTGGYVKKEEYGHETWTWKRQDLVEREFCTAVVLKDLEPYKKDLVVDADKVE